MKIRAVLTLLFLGLETVAFAQESAKLEWSTYYNIFSSGDLENANNQLDIIKSSNVPGKEAYEGALLMKMADLAKGPGEKLSLFKSGHEKLEKAISEDGNNPEFRFLRLMIQENAPKILGYHDNVEEDSLYILENIKELRPVVQEAVVDYSKKSEVLNNEALREALE